MIREAAHFRAIHPKNEDHEEDWALFLPPPPVDSEHSSDTNPNYWTLVNFDMDNSIHKIDIEIKKKIVNNDIDIKKGGKNQPDEKRTNKNKKGALEGSNIDDEEFKDRWITHYSQLKPKML